MKDWDSRIEAFILKRKNILVEDLIEIGHCYLLAGFQRDLLTCKSFEWTLGRGLL